ncbi:MULTISPECIES: cupin domain-containing protein [unclassified Rhizobium]
MALTTAAHRTLLADQTASVLENLASLLRVRPQIQQVCSFGGAWTSEHDIEEEGWAPFHIVTSGECTIEIEGVPPRLLRTGDVAILPHGGSHSIRGVAGGMADRPIETHSRQNDAIVTKTNVIVEPDVSLVCGRLKFIHDQENAMIAALPRLVIIGAENGPDPLRITRHVELISEELSEDRMGAAAIAEEIASALMIVVFRAHFESSPLNSGVLALLAQRQTARALSAMLTNPSKDWSLDALAAEATTSRATLVRMFKRIVDKAPLAFLTELRLNLAHQKIRATNMSIAAIAEQVGYQSENSLSRAYVHRFGHTPGTDRQSGVLTP